MAVASRYCWLEGPQTEKVLDRLAVICGDVSGLVVECEILGRSELEWVGENRGKGKVVVTDDVVFVLAG